MVRLGLAFLWVCALYMACSSAIVSLSGWNSGSDIDVPFHDVSVSGLEEKIAFNGSSE